MDSFAAYNYLSDFEMYSKPWLDACIEVTKPVLGEVLEALKHYGLTENDIENLPRPDGVAIKVKNVEGDIACNYSTDFEYEVLDADGDCHRCNDAADAVKTLLGRPAQVSKEEEAERSKRFGEWIDAMYEAAPKTLDGRCKTFMDQAEINEDDRKRAELGDKEAYARLKKMAEGSSHWRYSAIRELNEIDFSKRMELEGREPVAPTTTLHIDNEIKRVLDKVHKRETADVAASVPTCAIPQAQQTSGMNTIVKYNLVSKTAEQIAVFSSEWTRKLASLNASDAQIKICSEVPKGKKEETAELEAAASAELAHYCADGFEYNGQKFLPFMAGSSDIRKATATWLRADLIPVMGKWALCGLETKNMKLAINKYMAYLGLLSSASKPFAECFGKPIDIRRVAIIPDGCVTVSSVVDLVNGNNISHDADRSCEINAFDGFGIIRKNLTHGESCTLRGPWLKAFVQAVDFRELACFAYGRNVKPEFKDFWGNVVALRDVDVILTESCFKAAKLYESWEKYQNAFEQMGHTICVCVREHSPRLKGMPYQQGQTLAGTEDDALSFAAHAKSTTYKYHDPKEAAKLLRGDHRAAARLYPALLNEQHTRRSIQEKYASKRNDMLGGRIPELGYNAFLAPDLVAFAEHLFGLPIKGFLKAGECCCLPAEIGPVDVTRNPHLDNAHCVMMNRVDLPLAEGPTMFINIWDMTTIRLRADYDGDHVWYSQDEHLLNLVDRTFDQLKTIPIDWDVDKAEKVAITKSAICGFITNLLHGSEIGIYADTMTKMWNSQYDRDVCDWLTFAGNVLIDAAKHAAVQIRKPEDVQALSAIPLPKFAMYAKADVDRPVDSDYWTEIRKNTGTPRMAYSGSFLDMYSKFVDENVPENLTIDGLEDEIFDPTILMIKPGRKQVPGLFKKGKFNMELGTYEDSGLFQQISFRHTDEWNSFMQTDGAKMHRDEWEAARKHEALREIVFYCRSLYADDPRMDAVSDDAILDAAYDSIVRFLFTAKMSEGMLTVVMQCFWMIFGDRAVKALKKNLGTDITDEELLEDFDDDSDLFDAE